MVHRTKETAGLRTSDALARLKRDISESLVLFRHTNKYRYRTTDIIHPSNEKALVVWPTLAVSFLYGCMLYFTYEVSDSKHVGHFLLFEAAILWILGIFNAFLVYNENKLTVDEIPSRVEHSLDQLEKVIQQCNWTEENYPHLCAPFSPCVTLQWTYRDGKMVNLPWALLVNGDVIVMRPGQEAPGNCEALDGSNLTLVSHQIFQPSTVGKGENITIPRAVYPHKNKLFKMLETPYVTNLQSALEKAVERPVTVHNKQRHLIVIRCIETYALPGSIVVILIASFVRYLYLAEFVGIAHWTTIFLLQVVATTLPLLPTVFPFVWVVLNLYGIAKFKYLLQMSINCEKKYSRGSQQMSQASFQPQSATSFSIEDEKSIWKIFYNIFLGRENFVSRSANIVQVLGSVTALCCVDKKGILSWPNPTAEKVFFLRNSGDSSHKSSKSSFIESNSYLSNGNAPESHSENFNKANNTSSIIPCMNSVTVAEVLDLTHDQNIPFGLAFDDTSWKKYITSLKPLGLAILVNTCNINTQEHYSHFCSHITCEATHSEDVVPVTNRRCLCELAKQIGFSEEAKNIYALQNNLATYRHLPPEMIRRDTKFARSLHLTTRVKVPLPHMLSVIIKDQPGGLQLMSQGTADIILDSCVEYWNGQDLCVLSASDRKKVLDFYQRSSLTAYCSAFSYKPLTQGVSPQLASMFLELPVDSPMLYSSVSFWNEAQSKLNHMYHSTDSLLFTDTKEEEISDVDGCFDLQSHQVFIGMVTMQYQAQNDMVELIERLDSACIRFVHFSKENELRSRVFSEKMGLESGWNCHISLSSDNEHNTASSQNNSQNLKTHPEKHHAEDDSLLPHKNDDNFVFLYGTLDTKKQLSNSAPGAINVEHTVVKFENDTRNTCSDKRNSSIISNQHSHRGSTLRGRQSQDSVLLQGWETDNPSPPDGCRSLSCLTDSTDHSVPVNFDMRNRAKLPRGIDNIRPHIEQVDNVPLLVSLFTDCTANTARRMIGIMQDYNEIVCVMGSAANKDNMEIFMQADASIAVEPLYPVLCQKVPPYKLPPSGIGPVDLARILNSIACSISLTRESDVSLFSLVTMARHFMLCLWNSVQFWLSAVCSVTVLQLLSVIFTLPMLFSVGNVMWLSVIVIPLISVALMCLSIDPTVMKKAIYKHQSTVNLKASLFVFWCYGCRFLPSIILVLSTYGAMLMTFCNQIMVVKNSTECLVIYPNQRTESGVEVDGNSTNTDSALNFYPEWGGWGDLYRDGYILSQQVCFLMFFILIVITSSSFVHREHLLWQKNVFSNRVWLIVSVVLCSLHVIYFVVMLYFLNNELESNDNLSFHIPLLLLLLMFVSPFIVLMINEFIKWQEIKVNLRYQRRARLEFGTKLGMNSPF